MILLKKYYKTLTCHTNYVWQVFLPITYRHIKFIKRNGVTMILETSRLLLRPLSVSDAIDMYEYSKKPNVALNAGLAPHRSIKETKKIIRNFFIPQPYLFGMVLKYSGKLIGTPGLVTDPKREYNRVKMLCYAMSQDYWGNGYMTEACKELLNFGFQGLELEMVSCYCFPHNIKSQNVIKRLGFSYEGRLTRCQQDFNGNTLDNDCYALTKERYCSLNRIKAFNIY